MEFLIFVGIFFVFISINAKAKNIVDLSLDNVQKEVYLNNLRIKKELEEELAEDIKDFDKEIEELLYGIETTTNISNHQENITTNNIYVQNNYYQNYKQESDVMRTDEVHTYDDWKDLGYQVMKGEKSSHRVRNTAGFTREQVIKKDYYLN